MAAESQPSRRTRAAKIARELARLYPQAQISLGFETPWQCLVATILSAQCTDERVNQITPALFAAIPDIGAMAAAPRRKIEELIMSTGFFRQKAQSLKAAATSIIDRFGGVVPSTMDELVTLRGVGRKTANVLLGHVFGQPGLVVDTHVRRLSRRLGLTRNIDPEKIEGDLQKLLPPDAWTPFSMRLILHGRQVCIARKPQCGGCTLNKSCPRIGVAPAHRISTARPNVQ